MLLSSCSIDFLNKDSNDTRSNSNTSFTSGVEFGFNHTSGTTTNELVHRIKSTEHYSPTVSIKNNYPVTVEYRLYLLFDYKLHEMKYKEMSMKEINIVLKPSESSRFNIDLGNITPGKHDVIAILVRDPENVLEEAKFITPGDVYYSRRVILYSNDDLRAPGQDIFTLLDPAKPTEMSSTPWLTINSNDHYKDLITLTSQNKFKELYFHYTFDNTDYKKFALITFYNGELVNQKISLIKVNGTGEISIPINIKGVSHPSNLIAAIVLNPFEETTDFLSVRFTNLVTIAP